MCLKTDLLLFSFLSFIEKKNFQDCEMFFSGGRRRGLNLKPGVRKKIEQYSNINKDSSFQNVWECFISCGEKKYHFGFRGFKPRLLMIWFFAYFRRFFFSRRSMMIAHFVDVYRFKRIKFPIIFSNYLLNFSTAVQNSFSRNWILCNSKYFMWGITVTSKEVGRGNFSKSTHVKWITFFKY